MAFARHFWGFWVGAAIPLGLILGGASMLSGAAVEGGLRLNESLERKVSEAAAMHGKLVILAGSSGRFGFSAKFIEETFGIPAINMSANIGLGRKYLLYYAKPAIRADDVVVLPLEYHLYEKERADTVKSIQVIAFDQAYLFSLPTMERLTFLMHVDPVDWARLTVSRLMRPSFQGVPSRRTLNEWGDEISNRKESARPERVRALIGSIRRTFELDLEAIEDITAFARYAEGRGARVVVTYPPILRDVLDTKANASFLEAIKSRLGNKGIPVIGTPLGAAFDESEAFDSVYHENSDAQKRSSARLVADLVQSGLVPRVATLRNFPSPQADR